MSWRITIDHVKNNGVEHYEANAPMFSLGDAIDDALRLFDLTGAESGTYRITANYLGKP